MCPYIAQYMMQKFNTTLLIMDTSSRHNIEYYLADFLTMVNAKVAHGSHSLQSHI